MRWLRVVFGLMVVLIAVNAVSAQSGGLKVVVTDPAGSPLPGATVLITHNAKFIPDTAELTDKDGVVLFPVLRAGSGYTIKVSFPGTTEQAFPVRVNIGETNNLNVQLTSNIEERVEVKATTGDVVQLEDTTSSTRFSDDFIEDLPVAGNRYQNILTLAPGVQDADGDGNPNVHGSRDRDFRAEVSGISNVDPLTGQQLSQVNPDSIEALEVVTAGASLEYGRAQGGFANIVQKQGTNDFEGVASFLFRSSLFDGDGAGDNSSLPTQGFETIQPAVSLSGPLVKDKLWYRLSHELIDVELPVNVTNGIVVQGRTQQVNADQLTWQVSPRNKLAFQYQADPLEITNFGVSSLVPAESAFNRDFETEQFQVTWTAPFSPRILVETTAAYQDFSQLTAPTTQGLINDCVSMDSQLGILNTARCTNLETNEVSGSASTTLRDSRQRFTLRGRAEVFGGRFLGVQHQFRTGFLVENERYFRDLEFRPEIFFFIFDGINDGSSGNQSGDQQGVVLANVSVPQRQQARATGTNWAFFIEDSIRPLSNLSIQFGVRVDREEINSEGETPIDSISEFDSFVGRVDGGQAVATAAQDSFTGFAGLQEFVVGLAALLGQTPAEVGPRLSQGARESTFYTRLRKPDDISIRNTNFSPRLAISWDPGGNGKTRLAFAGRRLYDKIVLGVPTTELSINRTSLAFNVAGTPETGFTNQGLRNSIDPGITISSVARDLETPYNDEFVLSFEREIAPETSIGVEYVNRRFRNQLQDVNVNLQPGDFGRCRVANASNNKPIEVSPGTGTLIDPFTGEMYEDTDPGVGDGIVDDCSGEIVQPFGAMEDPIDPFDRAGLLQRPDGFSDLYTQNPGWVDIYDLGNLNSIDYDGYVLSLTRRQYRGWELQASYTYSEAIGDGEDFAQVLGDDPSLEDQIRSFQSYDQRHVVKVNAITITPWGFRLGTALSWESGLPFSLIQQQFSFPSTPPQFGSQSISGSSRIRQTYVGGQRNSERNEGFYNVDVRFSKELRLGRSLNVQITAEVFNLLNDDTLRIYNPVTQSGQVVNGNAFAIQRFGRRWQLGTRIQF